MHLHFVLLFKESICYHHPSSYIALHTYCHCRLRAYIAFTLTGCGSFSVITFPNLNRLCQNSEYKWGTTVGYYTKYRRKSPQVTRWWQTIPERGVVGLCEPLNFVGHQPYLWNCWSSCCQILFTGRLWQVPAHWRQITIKRGLARVMWPITNFWGPSDISGTAEARVVKFCTRVDYNKS